MDINNVNVETSYYPENMSMHKEQKTSYTLVKRIVLAACMACCLLVTVLGFFSYSDIPDLAHVSRQTTSHMSYGGDAYTGIQNAAADASTNAYAAADNAEAAALQVSQVSNQIAILIGCMGLIALCYFGTKFTATFFEE